MHLCGHLQRALFLALSLGLGLWTLAAWGQGHSGQPARGNKDTIERISGLQKALELRGEYLVTFEETQNDFPDEYLSTMLRLQPAYAMGTIVWVIEQSEQNRTRLRIEQYEYVRSGLSPLDDDLLGLQTPGRLVKRFVKRLPLEAVEIDAQRAKIRYKERERALNGGLTVTTMAVILEPQRDGFSGRYQYINAHEGGPFQVPPTHHWGNVKLVRNLEENADPQDDFDF